MSVIRACRLIFQSKKLTPPIQREAEALIGKMAKLDLKPPAALVKRLCQFACIDDGKAKDLMSIGNVRDGPDAVPLLALTMAPAGIPAEAAASTSAEAEVSSAAGPTKKHKSSTDSDADIGIATAAAASGATANVPAGAARGRGRGAAGRGKTAAPPAEPVMGKRRRKDTGLPKP